MCATVTRRFICRPHTNRLARETMSPLSVPNFSPIRACIRVLWRILRSVRNEEEKNEEIKTTFCSLVSRKRLERFSSNLVCRLPLLAGTSLANLVPIG